MRTMRRVRFWRRSLGVLGPLFVALVVAANAGALPTYQIVALGLLDAEHTRNDGYRYSVANFLTESGYAAGYSTRYSGATYLGQSAWLYDAGADEQDSILLSERSDGYAYSSVSFLSEEGLALGSYQLFDTDDTDLGTRAFAWTPVDGAVDLGALVEGGLTAAGWSYLAFAIQENGLDQILGKGRLSSGGDLAYLLTAIPEPSTALLLAAGLAGLAASGRRRSLR